MTKLLAFTFWDLRRFFRFLYDDGLADFKAMAVIVCTEILGIMAIMSVISVILGYRIFPAASSSTLVFGALLSVAVTAGNFYFYRSQNKDRWVQFDSEFEGYSRRTKTLGGLAIFAVITGVFVTTLVSMGAARHLS